MKSAKLKKIQVTNFRNLENDVIEFSDKINCIFGENGNGKTNILEAIYFIFYKKSFRKNTSFPQFLGIDGDKPEIYFSSIIDLENEIIPYTGKVEEKNSIWYLNNQPVKRKINSCLIFINPFDSYEFHNVPSFRRTWFDHHHSMYDDDYKTSLKKYNGYLKNRNILLKKQPAHFREQIIAIDKERAKTIKFLTQKKLEFINLLSESCETIFQKVFSINHQLKINLDSKFINLNEDQIFEMLQQKIEKELILGHSLYGSHKDDYVLLFDGLNSYDYCSLGQQKMSFISLLFAYIELFRYKFGSFPIVLIDDVSGELDRVRWANLIDYLNKSEFQVFITTANEKFKQELEKIKDVKKIFVDSGKVQNL